MIVHVHLFSFLAIDGPGVSTVVVVVGLGVGPGLMLKSDSQEASQQGQPMTTPNSVSTSSRLCCLHVADYLGTSDR